MDRRTVTGVGVGLGMLAIGTVAAGRQGRTTEPATLGDVVREVQALRGDLRDTAAGQLRLQALVTRVIVQEQRLRAVTEHRDHIETLLDDLRLERQAAERLASQFDPDSVHASRARELQQRQQRLEERARSYAERIADEQARWTDINAQLDAFERTLPRPR